MGPVRFLSRYGPTRWLLGCEAQWDDTITFCGTLEGHVTRFKAKRDQVAKVWMAKQNGEEQASKLTGGGLVISLRPASLRPEVTPAHESISGCSEKRGSRIYRTPQRARPTTKVPKCIHFSYTQTSGAGVRHASRDESLLISSRCLLVERVMDSVNRLSKCATRSRDRSLRVTVRSQTGALP